MNLLLITNEKYYEKAANVVKSFRKIDNEVYVPYDFYSYELNQINKLPNNDKEKGLKSWSDKKILHTKKLAEWKKSNQAVFYYPTDYELTYNDLFEIITIMSNDIEFIDLFERNDILAIHKAVQAQKEANKILKKQKNNG